MRRVFDFFRGARRTCDDPVFGSLRYDNRSCWTGEVRFPPTDEVVLVMVETGGPEPGDAHHATFNGLVERYASLRPSISAALFALWEPYRHEVQGRGAEMTSESMLQYTTLESILVRAGSQLRLGYGLDPSIGWDDATLSVRIEAWRVSPESVDD